MFKGLITALITPFKNDQLDFNALEKLIEHQIKNNVEGLILAGTTGEGFLLEAEEFSLLAQEAIKLAAGRIKIYANCSGLSTKNIINFANQAQEAGVDGLMAAPSSYLKPSQEGLYEHFKALNSNSSVPIMLYSNPSRTQVDFSVQTIIKLSQLNNIIALKDSSANLDRILNLKNLIGETEFNFLCGDDSLALAFFAHGAIGWVSVASNAFPRLCKDVHDAWMQQDARSAFNKQSQLLPLYNALSSEGNPIGIKFAMHLLGFCTDEIRLPLTKPSVASQEQIKQVIEFLNINNL